MIKVAKACVGNEELDEIKEISFKKLHGKVSFHLCSPIQIMCLEK